MEGEGGAVVTTVIKVNGRGRDGFLADPNFVYVGRPFAGFAGSIWGNPFKGPGAVDGFRDELVRATRYANCLMPVDGVAFNRFEVMAFNLPKLKGKTLGCWCGCWKPGEPEIPCHAVVLAKLANSLEQP